jgi:signal transduction histidine kinase
MPFRVASAALDANGRPYTVTVAAPMGPAYAALNRFHEWLLVLLPATILLAGAGGYFVSRRALAPVDHIIQAVRAITVQNLDRRLELPPADDELRRLAITFNDVLARLEAAVGDIVRFTAEASHELRTPVSLIRTTAELALRHDRSDEDYRRALADVGAQAQHMSSLIDDLMVLARSDAGIEPRGAASLDMRDAVGEAVGEIAAVAAEREVILSVDVPPVPVTLRGDEQSLRRALLILLDNAIKYSRSGGEVRVRLEGHASSDAQPAGARLSISDAGIGLDEAERPRIFERFYRGARARQHAPEGTGLGLSIARTIVDRHGGTLALAPGPAGGCEAQLTLPVLPGRAG